MPDDASLELTLQFAPLARRPDKRRFGRRWDVCVEIDGALHVFEEGPRHIVAISPGGHEVRVWFRGAGVAFLARGVKFGLRNRHIDAERGASVRLIYEGSTFWHMGGGAELRLA